MFSAVVALGLNAGVGIAAGASSLRWGTPTTIDTAQPFTDGTSLLDVSCPDNSLCAVAEQTGRVGISQNPGAASPTWTVHAIDTHPLGAMSCITGSFCATVDNAGNVLVSDDPASAGATWATQAIDRGHSLSAISCPNTSLCVAVDDAGNALAGDDPAGAAATWAAQAIDRGHSLTAISCPNTSLCVAVDDAGDVLITQNPTAAGPVWAAARIDGKTSLSGVSCPATTLCVAVDANGNAVTTTDPTASAPAWKAVGIDFSTDNDGNPTNELAGISCPSTTLCVTAGVEDGTMLTSTDPAAKRDNWTQTDNTGGLRGVTGVSCVAASLCTFVDQLGDATETTDPAATRPRFATQVYDGTNFLEAVTCVGRALCVATDGFGRVITTTVPGAAAPQWSARLVDPPSGAFAFLGHLLPASACASRSLCLVGDDSDRVFISTNPAAGGAAHWSPSALGDPTYVGVPSGVIALACPSAHLCLAGTDDANGIVDVTRDPTAARVHWRRTHTGDEVAGLACPSASLCVAATQSRVLVTHHPGAAWTTMKLGPAAVPYYDAQAQFEAVACPSARLCVVVDDRGMVRATHNIAARAPRWQTIRAASLPPPPAGAVSVPRFWLSCPSNSMCVLTADSGQAYVTRNPGARRPRWTGGRIDPPANLSVQDSGPQLAVACGTPTLCVAVDGTGHALVGRP